MSIEPQQQCSSTLASNVVEHAILLARAIGECDEGVMNSIFDQMESSEIIEVLLCESPPDFKSSAIKCVCKYLNFEHLEVLMRKLSDDQKRMILGHKGSDGQSAFHVAVEKGNFKLVAKLLELNLADPKGKIRISAKRNSHLQETTSVPGESAFRIAARTGDFKSLFLMIRHTISEDEAVGVISALETAQNAVATKAVEASESLATAEASVASKTNLVKMQIQVAKEIVADMAASAQEASKAVEAARREAATASEEAAKADEVVDATAAGSAREAAAKAAAKRDAAVAAVEAALFAEEEAATLAANSAKAILEIEALLFSLDARCAEFSEIVKSFEMVVATRVTEASKVAEAAATIERINF